MSDFSTQSALYAKFRPQFPAQLFDFITNQLKSKGKAWDAGTGNGQVAVELAKVFNEIIATDKSEKQLRKADKKENIIYRLEEAENTDIADNSIDLVTVGQAIHWFDFDSFFKEVKRVLKPGGHIAVMGYGVFKSEPEVDQIVHEFYTKTVGPFWDERRKYIDEEYRTIPFPFNEIKAPEFKIEVEWTANQLIGYLQSWSAVQAYINEHNSDPVETIASQITDAIPKKMNITFPVFLKFGKL